MTSAAVSSLTKGDIIHFNPIRQVITRTRMDCLGTDLLFPNGEKEIPTTGFLETSINFVMFLTSAKVIAGFNGFKAKFNPRIGLAWTFNEAPLDLKDIVIIVSEGNHISVKGSTVKAKIRDDIFKFVMVLSAFYGLTPVKGQTNKLDSYSFA